MSLHLCVEVAKMDLFVVDRDLGCPSTSNFVEASAKESSGFYGLDPMLLVLNVAYVAEVSDPVVVPDAVDVINLLFGPLAVNI